MSFCTPWIVESVSSFGSGHFFEKLWVSIGVHPIYPVFGSPLFCKAPSHNQPYDTYDSSGYLLQLHFGIHKRIFENVWFTLSGSKKFKKYSRKFSPWSSYPCGCCGASKCPLWIWCWWGTGLGLLWSEIEKRKLNRIRFLNSTSGCLEYKPSRGRERQYFRITLVDFIKKWSKNWVWFKIKSTCD